MMNGNYMPVISKYLSGTAICRLDYVTLVRVKLIGEI